MENFPKVPPEWGDDPLSTFIQGTTDNTYATFYNLKEWYNRLRDIHVVSTIVAENMNRSPDFFTSFFFVRSHSAFLDRKSVV